MSRSSAFGLIALLGATFSIHVTGCSLVGLAGGALWDARRPRIALVPTGRVEKFHRGDRLVLILADSSRVAGVYRGAAELDRGDYRRRYAAWRAAEPRASVLPEIGERVRRSRWGSGSVVGFVHRGVLIERRGETRVVPVTPEGTLTRADGAEVELAAIDRMMTEGVVPLLTALRIDTGAGEERVPLDRVVMVQAPTHPHGARTGFLIGLVADAIVVGSFASSYRGAFDGSGCASSGFGTGY